MKEGESLNKDLNSSINKAESHERLAVPAGAERGQPYKVSSTRFIQDSKKKDLAMPTRLCTFDRMCEDDAVYTAIDYTTLHVVNAMSKGKFTAKTKKGQVAADFLNYCIHNMSFGTWRQAMKDASTALKYGFSFLNIVTEVRNYGPYKGNRVLKKLSPRDQRSLYGFYWDKDFREFRGIIQYPKTSSVTTTRSSFDPSFSVVQMPQFKEKKYTFIDNRSLLHFTHNSTNRNPQGDSPLAHCYDAWAEKKLVERLIFSRLK